MNRICMDNSLLECLPVSEVAKTIFYGILLVMGG